MYSINHIDLIEFKILSPEQIQRRSVEKITSIPSKSANSYGTVDSLRLGPRNKHERCLTCNSTLLDQFQCPGHLSYIDLDERFMVYNILFIKHVEAALRIFCHHCGNFFIDRAKIEQFLDNPSIEVRREKMRYVFENFMINIAGIKDGTAVCHHCGKRPNYYLPTIKARDYQEQRSARSKEFMISGQSTRTDQYEYIYPFQAFKILSMVREDDLKLLGYSMDNNPRNMIFKYVPVIPRKFLPENVVSAKLKSESALTQHYNTIVKHLDKIHQDVNITIDEIVSDTAGDNAMQAYIQNLKELTVGINSLLDKTVLKRLNLKNASVKYPADDDKVKRLNLMLSKNDGLIKNNIFTKRVNNTARTVISGDPTLPIDTIGIPVHIAKINLIREKVTEANYDRLLRMFINNDTYPGAKSFIKQGTNYRMLINKYVEKMKRNGADVVESMHDMEFLQIGDIIERHLIDGDIVSLNREPAINVHSVGAFKVRVLNGSTIRINLSDVGPFNADFDGDEMNMKTPDTTLQTIEFDQMMSIPRILYSKQTGKLQILSVLDPCFFATMLSEKDVWVSYSDILHMMQYSNIANFPKGSTLPKPINSRRKLWSGKQVVSLIIPNVNYTDGSMKIVAGNIVQGSLTKKRIYRLIDYLNDSYADRDMLYKFIDNIDHFYSQGYLVLGASSGIDDIIVQNHDIWRKIDKIKRDGVSDFKRDFYTIFSEQRKQIEGISKFDYISNYVTEKSESIINAIYSIIRPYLLERDERQLFDIVNAGIKGKPALFIQILAFYGIQLLNGKYLPQNDLHRLTVWSPRGDFRPEYNGMTTSSLSESMTLVELMNGAVTSRRGKIDQKAETADSGYSTKKVIELLYTLVIYPDYSVRDHTGRVIQDVFAGDGFDVRYTREYEYPFKNMTNKEIASELRLRKAKHQSKELKALLSAEYDTIVADKDTLYNELFKRTYTIDIRMLKIQSPINVDAIIAELIKRGTFKGPVISPQEYITRFQSFLDRLPDIYGSVQTHQQRLRYAKGLERTKIYLRSRIYCRRIVEIEHLTTEQVDLLFNVIMDRLKRALAQVGTYIGSVAAYAISEPVTQMSIDSFHADAKSGGLDALSTYNEIISVKSEKLSMYEIVPKDPKDMPMLMKQFIEWKLKYLVDTYSLHYIATPPNQLKGVDFDKYSRMVIKCTLNLDKILKYRLTMPIIAEYFESHFPELKLVLPSIHTGQTSMWIVIHRMNLQEYMNKHGLTCVKVATMTLLETYLHALFGVLSNVHIVKRSRVIYKDGEFVTDEYDALVGTGNDKMLHIITNRLIDLTRFRTTDYVNYYKYFGIRAGRNMIVDALIKLFDYDTKIDIDKKYIYLYADNAFSMGEHIAALRAGIDKQKDNYLERISFENNFKNIVSAAKMGATGGNTIKTNFMFGGHTIEYGIDEMHRKPFDEFIIKEDTTKYKRESDDMDITELFESFSVL